MTDHKWKSYQEVAAHLLNQMAAHFDLERVEGTQDLAGLRSGTSYTIDAKGVRVGSEAFVLIECRCYTTSKQKQEHLAALAYRIIDTGAAGGIIVSPLGLQEGATRIADAEHIISVQLSEDSTTTEYVLAFLNKLVAAVTDDAHVEDSAVAVLRDVVTGEEQRLEST